MEKNSIIESFIKASKNFKTPKLNKIVKYGATNFKYADLSEVYACVKGALLDEGFSIVHNVVLDKENSYIETYLQHVSGETYGNCSFPLGIIDKKMQDIGAQLTYLKRYSIASICSIAAEEDDDASNIKNTSIELVSFDEVNKLKYILSDNPELEKKLLERQKISSWEELPKEKFQPIFTWVLNIQKQKGISNENN